MVNDFCREIKEKEIFAKASKEKEEIEENYKQHIEKVFSLKLFPSCCCCSAAILKSQVVFESAFRSRHHFRILFTRFTIYCLQFKINNR